MVTVDELADIAVTEFRAAGEKRHLIGIAGPPGAGKSTLTAGIVRACEKRLGAEHVIGLPMDGFHLTTAELARLGRLDRRGAPDTFDAGEFVATLRKLVDPASPPVKWPEYSRRIDEPIADAITVSSPVGLIFVEGNYLLLPRPPWNEISEIVGTIWYLAEDEETIESRLRRRQLAAGKSVREARAFVDRSDMANAKLIEQSKDRADQVVRIGHDDPLLADLRDPATNRLIQLD